MKQSKPHILIIEDSKPEQVIYHHLLSAEYEVTTFESWVEAQSALLNNKFDLVILDIVLPGHDGYEICQKLRNTKKTQSLPIMFVTAKRTLPDQLAAFSLGADDFLSKPVNPLELKARIYAKLRNFKKQNAATIINGQIEIDPKSRRVSVYQNGQKSPVKLTKHEFEILHYFAQHPDQVFSRQQILDHVWGATVSVTDRTIDSHISKLRKKLGTAGDAIEAVHGTGYRLANKDNHLASAA